MNKGRYLISQILNQVNHEAFNRCVEKYHGSYRVRTFSCWSHFVCLSFGQLTNRDSLRDIVFCLRCHQEKLYHLGIKGQVSKSTLADASESRDWRIYADFGMQLIKQARKLYQGYDATGLELDNALYALDATTIDLCLNVFVWAKFRKHKGAIKANVLLDLKCELPTFIHISIGKVHEVNVLDKIEFETNAFYIMDKGYIDFARFYTINQAQAYFITRAKTNFACRRVYSHKVDKATGLKYDQTIRLTGTASNKDYPKLLRRIKYYDKEQNKTYIFITNNFEVEALQIAQLYKNRWKIEIFFRWIKQNLKIKIFWGTSQNAVYTQIWVGIATFVLVLMLKKKYNILHSITEMLQLISVSPFEQVPLNQLIMKSNLQKNNQPVN